MVAGLNIEFEEEEEVKPKQPQRQELELSEESLEFSAATDVIEMGGRPRGDSSTPKEEVKIETKIEAQPVEISEEMKAVVDKVKSEAQVRSLSEVREKKLQPAAKAAPVAKAAPRPAPLPPPSPESYVNENPLAEKLDAFGRVQLDAELRIAKAEGKAEATGFYLGEIKILEYQVIALIKRLGLKSPEALKALDQIQKQFINASKKKPN